MVTTSSDALRRGRPIGLRPGCWCFTAQDGGRHLGGNATVTLPNIPHDLRQRDTQFANDNRYRAQRASSFTLIQTSLSCRRQTAASGHHNWSSQMRDKSTPGNAIPPSDGAEGRGGGTLFRQGREL